MTWCLLIATFSTVPVVAQPLPIAVDQTVAGHKPSVGIVSGVPVINIAPPSAGGVSNNHYTHFNVGPSGVVLNNSGGASQTQLAGQVGGNPMLGNQRAVTILNQVTANNPSRLLGTLEVAGHQARVIVANPAGITCNGCGFVNAGSATLTTGRPMIGADGSIDFDVATGRIKVEGDGLLGGNLSRVDLITRSLEVNAGIWADQLNVSLGAATVNDETGAVSAEAGQGVPPFWALDTSALGGMYANSIRLIGTEAGVGVNVAGHLVALTGDLQVNIAGDVRVTPSGVLRAARDVQLCAGREAIVQGEIEAGNAMIFTNVGDLHIDGRLHADGTLGLFVGGSLTLDKAGRLTQGAAAVTPRTDSDLVASWLRPPRDGIVLAVGSDLLLHGSAIANEGIHLYAGHDLRVDSSVLAEIGTLFMHSGNDLRLGLGSHVQGVGVFAHARRDGMFKGGLGSVSKATLTAGRHADVSGEINVGGSMTVRAYGDGIFVNAE